MRSLFRSFPGSPSRTLLSLALLLVGFALPARTWATVTANITADNAYVFGYGTSSSVGTLYGGVENCSAGAIFNCNGGPEQYTGVSTAGGTYLYIAAYCDNSTTQGVLGQFDDGSHITYTGIGPWEAYDTGSALLPNCAGSPVTPTQSQINSWITLANSVGGPGGSSVGWVTQAPPTGGRVGVLVSGELNDNAGGDFGQVCTSVISTAARWMWYNPSPGTIADPFTSSSARHLVLFRLPASAVTNPTAYYVNKDIKNASGVTANGVEMIVAGHHTYNDIFHATTPTFATAAVGANDKLMWTGGSIANGSIVHVGFRTSDSFVQILSVAMINNSDVQLGCARQLNTNVHTNANLVWKNDVTLCSSTPLFIGNVSVEFYSDEVPLSSLVPGGARTPISTASLSFGPQSIAPGDSAAAAMPTPPPGARWAVVHQQVGTTSGLGDTEDWIEVPLVNSSAVPIAGPWALGLVALGFLGLAATALHLRRRPLTA